MAIPLSFRHMLMEPGKTLAVCTGVGDRIRVVAGTVWATTSTSPRDVWLKAGEEHTVERRGLTVIESVTRSTVELVAPAASKTLGRITGGYDIALPKAACKLAAIAMTVITIGLLVVLPAKMAGGSAFASPAGSTVVAAPSGEEHRARG